MQTVGSIERKIVCKDKGKIKNKILSNLCVHGKINTRMCHIKHAPRDQSIVDRVDCSTS